MKTFFNFSRNWPTLKIKNVSVSRWEIPSVSEFIPYLLILVPFPVKSYIFWLSIHILLISEKPWKHYNHYNCSIRWIDQKKILVEEEDTDIYLNTIYLNTIYLNEWMNVERSGVGCHARPSRPDHIACTTTASSPVFLSSSIPLFWNAHCPQSIWIHSRWHQVFSNFLCLFHDFSLYIPIPR